MFVLLVGLGYFVDTSIIIGLAVLIFTYKVLDRLLRLPTVGDFSQRYVLITGCDTGFGNGFAKCLDSKGCHVIATCFTEKGETELRKACTSRLKSVGLDVANPNSVKAAYEKVKSLLPAEKGLWAIVNNAAIPAPICPVEWLNKESYMEVLAVNLLGLIDVTTTFLPLVKKEHGRIVNISSIKGVFCSQVDLPYTIS